MSKKVIIGNDHAGLDLKKVIADHLRGKGYEVIDIGTHLKESVRSRAYWRVWYA